MFSHAPSPAGHTWFELTDPASGRTIISRLLRDGDEVVLMWKNSLFGLTVTEVTVRLDTRKPSLHDGALGRLWP